jgi:hypothetical protein
MKFKEMRKLALSQPVLESYICYEFWCICLEHEDKQIYFIALGIAEFNKPFFSTN